MGSEGWGRRRPDRPRRAVFVFIALVGALLVAPNALAALYTVNSTADPGDGVCTVFDCTLREAIDAANASVGADDITFQIGIGGSYTIFPLDAAAGHRRGRHASTRRRRRATSARR